MTNRDPDGPLVETANETRQGPKGRPVLWVLVAGLALAVIALFAFMSTAVDEPPPSIGVTPEQSPSVDSTPGNVEPTPANPEAPARPRITYDWYRDFLNFLLDQEAYTWFAPIVVWGELLVGLGLIFGALVGIAAFFGTVMNMSFMIAGTVSSNPWMFGLTIFIILGWKVAGYLGLDRWLLPMLGTPWTSDEDTVRHVDTAVDTSRVSTQS